MIQSVLTAPRKCRRWFPRANKSGKISRFYALEPFRFLFSLLKWKIFELFYAESGVFILLLVNLYYCLCRIFQGTKEHLSSTDRESVYIIRLIICMRTFNTFFVVTAGKIKYLMIKLDLLTNRPFWAKQNGLLTIKSTIKNKNIL